MLKHPSRTVRRHGTARILGAGLVLALAVAITPLAPPAKAAFIGAHSGNASVNCPLPGGSVPSSTGADDVTVTCNDGNSNDQTVDLTIDIGADPFDTFSLGVQAFPSGNVLYTLRIDNSSGQDWTDFHFIFQLGGAFGPGLTGFASTDIVFDSGGGSLDSVSSGPLFIDLNFATAVTSGTGFDISYTLDHGSGSGSSCGTCATTLEPSNTFVPPPPPPTTSVSEPPALVLFAVGLLAMAALGRVRRSYLAV